MKKAQTFLVTFCLWALLSTSFGVAQDGAKNILTGFDEVVEKAMKEFSVPGAAIGISLNGKIILAKGYGVRNLTTRGLVDTQTLFPIGSCSKAFTAFVIGTLVDEKKLAWDEPVITYLPSFRLSDSYATTHATLRDMLSHRTGMPRHDLLWYNFPGSRDELVKHIPYLPFSTSFRETWQYNNLMYLMSGYIAETITGRTWEENVQERILRPLGMASTQFSVQELQQSNNFASPHILSEGEIRVVPFRDISAIGPAGSINSNLDDMLKWAEFQLTEGKGLIAKETFAEIHKPQVLASLPESDKIPGDEGLSYAFGWGSCFSKGHYRIAHSGSIDGFKAEVAFSPQDKLVVVVLTNQGNSFFTGMLEKYIFDQFYGNDYRDAYTLLLKKQRKLVQETLSEERKKLYPPRVPNTIPSHALEDYTGTYEDPGFGPLYVTVTEGKLFASYNNFDIPLQHWHYDLFVGERAKTDAVGFSQGLAFLFRTNFEGTVDRIEMPAEPTLAPIVFKRKQ